jgi:hypothetical protein
LRDEATDGSRVDTASSMLELRIDVEATSVEVGETTADKLTAERDSEDKMANDDAGRASQLPNPSWHPVPQ